MRSSISRVVQSLTRCRVVRFLSFDSVSPISRNQKHLAEWRKSIRKAPLKSPFPAIPVVRESMHEITLRKIQQHSIKNPDRLAMVDAANPENKITFGEIHRQAHSASAFLRNRGLKHGDVVATVLPNGPQCAVFNLGAWAAGGIITGTSHLFTKFELERQLLDSESTVVITNTAALEKVMQAASVCNKLKTIICVPDGSSLPEGVVDFNDVLATPPSTDLASVNADAVAALPYSSGTTGAQKGVMLTHSAIATQLEQITHYFGKECFPMLGVENVAWNKESMVVVMPNYHIYGFQIMNMCLWLGITNVFLDKFDPVVFLSAIQSYKPRMLHAVPPMVLFLAKHPIVQKFDLASLRVVLTGSAPCGKDLSEEFLAALPSVKFLSQGYGMTEVGLASHLPLYEKRDSEGSVGVVVSNFEQKTIDPVSGETLGVGETGEICVRGATMMKGYLNRPVATNDTIDAEGWLHTGDVGYYDENGYTYIVDRVKELIKVKGLQVAPAELEDILVSHPLIKDAAVIGIEDPSNRLGELVRAYVERSSEDITEQQIIDFVAEKVSDHKKITGGVKFMKAIPKSASGKILRRTLREEAVKEANQ